MECRIGWCKQTGETVNNYSPIHSFHLLPSGLINPKWYFFNPLRLGNMETDILHSMNFIGSQVVFHV